MHWPWQSGDDGITPRERFVASSLRQENEWREPVAPGAEIKREGTLQRILARNRAIEDEQRAATSRRALAALTFSIQLAPPVPARQLRPLKWDNRKAAR